jgi:hypothetical protein
VGSRAGRFRERPLAGTDVRHRERRGWPRRRGGCRGGCRRRRGRPRRRRASAARRGRARPGLDAGLRGRTRVPPDGRQDRRDGDAPGAHLRRAFARGRRAPRRAVATQQAATRAARRRKPARR